MSFERVGKFKNEKDDLHRDMIYRLAVSADGEKGIRVKVLLLNKYMVYSSVEELCKEWEFFDWDDLEYLLGLERYINTLQAELDRKKDRTIWMMGKDFDNEVIG